MSTVGRKPRGFKKPPISLGNYHLLWLEKIQEIHHQPDRSAAVRWLIDQYAEGRVNAAGALSGGLDIVSDAAAKKRHAK